MQCIRSLSLLAIFAAVITNSVSATRSPGWFTAYAGQRESTAGPVRQLAATQANEAFPEELYIAPETRPEVIPDHYIVVFEDAAGEAHKAAAALVEEVRASAAQAALAQAADASVDISTAPAAASNSTAAATSNNTAHAVNQGMVVAAASPSSAETVNQYDFEVLKPLTAHQGPEDAAAAVASSTSASSGSLLPQSAVVRASAAVLQHVRNSRLVKAVVPDLYLRAQVLSCVKPADLKLGVSSAAKPGMATAFQALGCDISTARLVWTGRTCRSGSSVSWTELRAHNRETNRLLVNSEQEPCVLRPSASKTANRQRFGGCGSAPTLARSLPTLVCSTAGSGTGDSPGAADPAGVLPRVLPRVPLQTNEQVPQGMKRIEAVTVDGVAGMASGTGVVVAVVDSGVDSTHPDIRYVGGKSFATPSPDVPNDVRDPGVDLYGHGTHVAGIVGAKNQGRGVVGVAPGVGIYSVKILNALGVGALSDAIAAINWVVTSDEAKVRGIRVVNLSLTAYLDPSSSEYQKSFDYVCRVFAAASDAGVVVVAAAGNSATSMKGYLPAACPTVMAVTSMDGKGNTPSSFSNWLDGASSTSSDILSTISSPGNGILSTISFAKDPSGYRELSGTSMASPHVAGIAATCFSSGACSNFKSGLEAFATIQSAAMQRMGSGRPGYGFKGDATSTARGRYYGYLAWAKF